VWQWFLSFPWQLRLLFASRPDALGRCLAVIVRAIQTELIRRAGLTASSGARTGVVTLIQRFGSALNLNIHQHMLIPDGVYTLEQNGPRFHSVGAPDTQTLERLLNDLVQRRRVNLTPLPWCLCNLGNFQPNTFTASSASCKTRLRSCSTCRSPPLYPRTADRALPPSVFRPVDRSQGFQR
jgi:Putative transposase